MGKVHPCWHALVSIALAGVLHLVLGGFHPSRAQSEGSFQAHIRDFRRLSRIAGWVWIDDRLYRTADAGISWLEITPSQVQGSRLAAVSFRNVDEGWALLFGVAEERRNTLLLAHTTNGGQSWVTTPIPLAEEDRFAPIASHYLTIGEANTLWIVQRYVSSANFSVGTLYRSVDGGKSWQRLHLPIAEPIRVASTMDLWVQGGPTGRERYRSSDGGISWMKIDAIPDWLREESTNENSDVRMATATIGWRLERQGNCDFRIQSPSPPSGYHEEGYCRTAEQLWSTEDGGRTWTRVSLPNGKTSLDRAQSVATILSPGLLLSQPQGEETPETPLIATLQGHAFDKCEIPSLDKLNVWRAQSPYRAVNLYIGGIHRACDNEVLSADFIAQLRQQGWGLIPTWVGPQARCTTYKYRMSKYPPKAYQEGRAEADDATLVAQQLGLTNQAGNGSVIYYDLEHYDVENDECNLAAQAFINGWVERMNELGMIGGVYSSGRALSQFVDLPNPPLFIWAAHWIADSYDAEATVWDVVGLSNEWWKDHQRLRQYAGGHQETWGDVALTIDSNVMDGVVSYHFYIPSGFEHQYYFPLIAR